MSEHSGVSSSLTQLTELQLKQAQGERARILVESMVAKGAGDGELAELLSLVGASRKPLEERGFWTWFSRKSSSDEALVARLYRVLDRLLVHLDLLAGDSRDTWWFRSRVSEARNDQHVETILDELEKFLVGADTELNQLRDMEARGLSFSQNQCEELIDQTGFTNEVLKSLSDALNQGTTSSEAAASEIDSVRRDITRVGDRVRTIERKINELHNNVRSRLDIGFKDQLTGVYQAEGFSVRCAELLARWQRAGSPLTLVDINIALGGGVSPSPLLKDDVMRLCSRELEARIRVSDVMARTEAAHFALLLPDTNMDGAHTFTSRTVAGLEARATQEFGDDFSLILHAGVTSAHEGDDVKTFMERGHTACQRAISEGSVTYIAR